MGTTRTWHARWGLGLVLAGYLVAGVLYAALSPAWQAPDEPAHYNYIRHLAQGDGLPILLPGDYPHQYLEAIKARRFPPDMPIAPLRYEFHQPPLYYLLAWPVYRLSGGALLPLRLCSVVLGAVLLWVVWRLAGEVAPGCPALRLTAVAFVAFLPMHVAMAASVNNDILAELWLALAGWGLVRF
ncbi:MAG: glycosyltransferase family 39 protein, partial [Anaerolineae bacterium]|nr:glycosyltransferase family 39 protein [Anaerolineae bacterium]